MMLMSPWFDTPLNLKSDVVNVLVIERAKYFRDFLYALMNEDGDIVISHQDTVLNISKDVRVIADILELSPDERILKNALYKTTQHLILTDYGVDILNIQAQIIELMKQLELSLMVDIDYNQSVDVKDLLKIMNLKFLVNNTSLVERILDYLKIIVSLSSIKLVVFVGLKQYFDTDELSQIYTYAYNNHIRLLLIERQKYDKLNGEKLHVLDKDLCFY